MTKVAQDVFGIAVVVAATAMFIGLHSWAYVG